MPLVAAGKINQQIELGTVSFAEDGEAGPTSSVAWSSPIWGSIERKGGSEDENRGVVEGTNEALITTRYFAATAAIKTKDRIRHGSRIYQIVSIDDPMNAHEQLQFTCRELVAQS